MLVPYNASNARPTLGRAKVQSDAYAGAQTTRTLPDNRSDRRRLPQQACQPDEATDETYKQGLPQTTMR